MIAGILGIVLWAGELPPSARGVLQGIAVNGTQSDAPLAEADVVLRANAGSGFAILAKTRTDASGQFQFADLPADGMVTLLAGVNHQGIHYPGKRVRLTKESPRGDVRLVAYDGVAAPSPLRCRQHTLHVRPEADFLEITEQLFIENPSRTTYVGEGDGEHPAVTLRLSVPAGLEKVTFGKELHGRNFLFTPAGLATQMPWLPGTQEVQLVYRVPANQRDWRFLRPVDLPTEALSLVVQADPHTVSSNLAEPNEGATSAREVHYQARNVAPGFTLELSLGGRPWAWEVVARFVTLALIVAFIAAAVLWVRLRRQPTGPQRAERPPSRARRQAA